MEMLHLIPLYYLVRVVCIAVLGGIVVSVWRLPLLLKPLFFVMLFVFFHGVFVCDLLVRFMASEMLFVCLGLGIVSIPLFILSFTRLYRPSLAIKATVMSCVAATVSVTVGLGQFWVALLLVLLFVLFVLGYRRVTGVFLRYSSYTLLLDFHNPDVLLLLDRLKRSFEIVTIDQQLSRKGGLHVMLTYQTNAIVQHLFTKRLTRVKGLHFTVTSS